MAVVDHFEEDLGGDVVGEIADQAEGLVFIEGGEVYPEEISADDMAAQGFVVFVEVEDHVGVGLNDEELLRALQQELGEHAAAGPHFYDAAVGFPAQLQAEGYALGNGVAVEEMLAV